MARKVQMAFRFEKALQKRILALSKTMRCTQAQVVERAINALDVQEELRQAVTEFPEEPVANLLAPQPDGEELPEPLGDEDDGDDDEPIAAAPLYVTFVEELPAEELPAKNPPNWPTPQQPIVKEYKPKVW